MADENSQDSNITVAVIQSEMRHITAMMDAMALEISQLRSAVNQMMAGVVLRPQCDIIHSKDEERIRALERKMDVMNSYVEDLRATNKSDQWITRLMSAGAVLAAYLLTKMQLP